MSRKQMVNAIYDRLRVRSELISRELWQLLAEMTDTEIEQKYQEVCENDEIIGGLMKNVE